MGLVYRLAPVVFMGGSLVRHGGQNPIEPAKLATAILHGPHVANFADVYAALHAAGGAEAVSGREDLAARVGALIGAPDEIARRADAAGKAVLQFAGALERTMDALEPLFAAISRRV
jgi:3-deoxy-D-manno-octulosonic-acid transferase